MNVTSLVYFPILAMAFSLVKLNNAPYIPKSIQLLEEQTPIMLDALLGCMNQCPVSQLV